MGILGDEARAMGKNWFEEAPNAKLICFNFILKPTGTVERL